MAPEIVGDASGLGAAIRPLVGQLRAAHVIRSSGSSERIETYHDRIREALVERMDAAAVRRRHGQLAGALRARHVDDPEALFEHLRGAGDHSEAAVQAGRTADRAASALAFDTAAAFYRDALDLASDSPSRQSWQAGRAAALANAGRPHEAGEAYLEASRDASAAGGIDLQRRAAEQFLIGGHIDRGLAMLRSVLDQVEIKFPAGPRAALASLLTRRARLGLRGLGFVERKASDVPADVLFRIDTCWSVMTGLATVDMIRAAAFSALHLHLALDAGEPYRIARALAVEAAFAAMPGGKNRTRAARLFERARQLAAALDRPHTNALLAVTSGMAALAGGRWRDASDLCEQALVILRDRCAGATWEINSAQNFLLGALLYQGELHEVATRVHPLLEEARSRGNLYVSTELCTRMNLVWLAADRPDEGERLAIESIDRWSQSGFHRQHYSAMLARVQTALYRGDARLAWTLLDESWPALQPTMLLRAQVVRVEAAYLRGRCAIAMASAGADARTFLRIALECARRIAGEDMFWSDPIARLLEACAAHLRRDDELSAARLAEAIDGFDRAGMQLYAAAARRRLADLAGGEKAHDARRRFDEWAARQRVVNPGAMTRMMAPGCRDY
jgi:tetratricopeptide (TPR) repeat protein